MSCESLYSTEALAFEQKKAVRNLGEAQAINTNIRLTEEAKVKIHWIKVDERKQINNLVTANSLRENFDEKFRVSRIVQSIDFDQKKAETNISKIA